MTDAELNAALDALATSHPKLIPYYGWWWREVDWANIYLANGPNGVAFCVNNKWEYPLWTVEGEAATAIRAVAVALVQQPTPAWATALHAALIATMPDWAADWRSYQAEGIDHLNGE